MRFILFQIFRSFISFILINIIYIHVHAPRKIAIDFETNRPCFKIRRDTLNVFFKLSVCCFESGIYSNLLKFIREGHFFKGAKIILRSLNNIYICLRPQAEVNITKFYCKCMLYVIYVFLLTNHWTYLASLKTYHLESYGIIKGNQ